MKDYSEAVKSKLVQRMLMPGGPSANALSREVGINQPTLSRWLRDATTLDAVTKRRQCSTAPASSAPRGVGQRGASRAEYVAAAIDRGTNVLEHK